MRALILSLAIFTQAAHALGQVEVPPPAVDAATRQARGPHLAYAQDEGNGKILITLGGTNSLPSDFRTLHRAALSLGYQVLAIDYPNTVITVVCRESKNPNCFDQFRSEIVTGAQVSREVDVDRANSIVFRIESLTRYLAATDARWMRFLREGSFDWSKAVLVGHSQGSGHAAYIAKLKAVARVLMIAGPQDAGEQGIANWVYQPGATAALNFRALLHKNDFFGSELQKAVFTVLVNNDPSALKNHLIVSEKPVGDAHMELIQEKFADEWLQLLSR